MINWNNILNRLRGIKDQQVEMYGIMRGCLEDAKNELLGFKEFLAYLQERKDYFSPNSDVNDWYYKEYPRASRNVEWNYYKYRKFLGEHGEDDCLYLLRKSITNAEEELDKWIREVCERYPGLYGKITCIEDYQQHGMQWIINECLFSPILYRFYDENNPEKTKTNIDGYLVMTEYLTGRPIIKKKYPIEEQYDSVIKEINKYNLKIK